MAKSHSPLGPFLGINNRRPDRDLAQFERGNKVGDFVKNAVNVDFGLSSHVSRRSGITQVVSGTRVHSLWGIEQQGFFVDGGVMFRFSEEGSPEIVRSGLSFDLPCSYSHFNGVTYWSNSAVVEKIPDGSTSVPLGVPVPNPTPEVSVTTGGSLSAGLYQMCIAAVTADGEQSGTTWPIQFEVPLNGKFTISNIRSGGYFVNVYLSPPNGDKLFRFLTLASSVETVTVEVMPQLLEQAITVGMRTMPPGQIVRHYNGRLLVASGASLCYSEPYAFALHNPAKGYIGFPSRITVCEPCQDGVFVVSDKTYWLAGPNIEQAELRVLLPYGATEGTGNQNHADTTVSWFSEKGIVVGAPGGKLRNLQEEHVLVGKASSGASLFREENGIQQQLASLFNAKSETAAVKTWIEAESIRKENML